MDPVVVSNWLRAAQIVAVMLSVTVSVYLFWKARAIHQVEAIEKARKDGDAALHGRIDGVRSQSASDMQVMRGLQSDMDKRLSVLEARVSALPTHNDLRDIREALAQVSADLSANSERTTTTLDAVRSLQKYLMERSAR